MDFHGKALKSSINNMILVPTDNVNNEVMLLAKFDDNTFNLCVKSPMNLSLALAVASASFQFKLTTQ